MLFMHNVLNFKIPIYGHAKYNIPQLFICFVMFLLTSRLKKIMYEVMRIFG